MEACRFFEEQNLNIITKYRYRLHGQEGQSSALFVATCCAWLDVGFSLAGLIEFHSKRLCVSLIMLSSIEWNGNRNSNACATWATEWVTQEGLSKGRERKRNEWPNKLHRLDS